MCCAAIVGQGVIFIAINHLYLRCCNDLVWEPGHQMWLLVVPLGTFGDGRRRGWSYIELWILLPKARSITFHHVVYARDRADAVAVVAVVGSRHQQYKTNKPKND